MWTYSVTIIFKSCFTVYFILRGFLVGSSFENLFSSLPRYCFYFKTFTAISSFAQETLKSKPKRTHTKRKKIRISFQNSRIVLPACVFLLCFYNVVRSGYLYLVAILSMCILCEWIHGFRKPKTKFGNFSLLFLPLWNFVWPESQKP